jgi:hypothetical protein
MKAGHRYTGDDNLSAALDGSVTASLGGDVGVGFFADIERCCIYVIVSPKVSL